jgi:hypothetical protein
MAREVYAVNFGVRFVRQGCQLARSLRLRSQHPWGLGRGETTRKILLGELACVRGMRNLSEVSGGSQPNN